MPFEIFIDNMKIILSDSFFRIKTYFSMMKLFHIRSTQIGEDTLHNHWVTLIYFPQPISWGKKQ